MKTALITGATSGIGRELANLLASQGWRTLIHGRDEEKVDLVCRTCGEHAIPFVADLSLVSDCRKLAADVRNQNGRIDALVLNAGTITKKREVTPEGFERMFAVNHLAPFVLTEELHTAIHPGGRLINVSTEAHRWVDSIDLKNLQAEKRFRVLKHYAATKAANLLTCLEWARRLSSHEVAVTAHHPGEVATSFGLHGPWWLRIFWRFSRRRFISPAEAAGYLINPLVSEEPSRPGSYWNRDTMTEPAPFVQDTSAQKQLWEFTSNLLNSLTELARQKQPGKSTHPISDS